MFYCLSYLTGNKYSMTMSNNPKIELRLEVSNKHHEKIAKTNDKCNKKYKTDFYLFISFECGVNIYL